MIRGHRLDIRRNSHIRYPPMKMFQAGVKKSMHGRRLSAGDFGGSVRAAPVWTINGCLKRGTSSGKAGVMSTIPSWFSRRRYWHRGLAVCAMLAAVVFSAAPAASAASPAQTGGRVAAAHPSGPVRESRALSVPDIAGRGCSSSTVTWVHLYNTNGHDYCYGGKGTISGLRRVPDLPSFMQYAVVGRYLRRL